MFEELKKAFGPPQWKPKVEQVWDRPDKIHVRARKDEYTYCAPDARYPEWEALPTPDDLDAVCKAIEDCQTWCDERNAGERTARETLALIKKGGCSG